MATEVEEIARAGKDDGDDDEDKDMSSYDDVEADAMKTLKKELGDEAASAISDYVKACIQRATEDDEEE